jgi:hypothetical protein
MTIEVAHAHLGQGIFGIASARSGVSEYVRVITRTPVAVDSNASAC